MNATRTRAACFDSVKAEMRAKPFAPPPLTLEQHVARARKEMGEARWQQLMAEWE